MTEKIAIEIGDWLPAPAKAIRPMFAIGDVHGRDDLFGPLIEAIEGFVLQDGLTNALLVTLGDYIDRGPGNIKALNRALDGCENKVMSFIALPGNHEQFLYAFLHWDGFPRANLCHFWFYNGGGDVARELGFDPKQEDLDLDAFALAVARTMGEERLDRFRVLRNHIRIGQYLFVHAGIHPSRGLAMLDRDWRKIPWRSGEEDRDPLWIRGPFLTYEGEHEDRVVVVHGHTPREHVELCANRINVDTGAYETGRLTAVQLLGSELRFIQAIGQRSVSAQSPG